MSMPFLKIMTDIVRPVLSTCDGLVFNIACTYKTGNGIQLQLFIASLQSLAVGRLETNGLSISYGSSTISKQQNQPHLHPGCPPNPNECYPCHLDTIEGGIQSLNGHWATVLRSKPCWDCSRNHQRLLLWVAGHFDPSVLLVSPFGWIVLGMESGLATTFPFFVLLVRCKAHCFVFIKMLKMVGKELDDLLRNVERNW